MLVLLATSMQWRCITILLHDRVGVLASHNTEYSGGTLKTNQELFV